MTPHKRPRLDRSFSESDKRVLCDVGVVLRFWPGLIVKKLAGKEDNHEM